MDPPYDRPPPGPSRPGFGARALIFRFVSELGIHYRRSPVVREGQPHLRAGPAAGDRLPDARVTRNGRDTFLQQELAGPFVNVLLCGPIGRWGRDQVTVLKTHYPDLLAVHYLDRHGAPGVLVDTAGEALSRLGLPDGRSDAAQYLVRPDGYIGFRAEARTSRNWLGISKSGS